MNDYKVDRNFSLEIFGTEENPFLLSKIKEVKSSIETIKELQENYLN